MELELPVSLQPSPAKATTSAEKTVDVSGSDEDRIYGLDLIRPSVKAFKPILDYVLIAVMQEVSVLSLITGKLDAESADVRFVAYMVVKPSESSLGIKPGDIPFIISDDSGKSLFGRGSLVNFADNPFSAENLIRLYKYREDGTPIKDHELRSGSVELPIGKRERIISFYVVNRHLIVGLYPEDYGVAFSVPLSHGIVKRLGYTTIVEDEMKDVDETRSDSTVTA